MVRCGGTRYNLTIICSHTGCLWQGGGMNYISACLIFKNEAKYLGEWIEFYNSIGIDHFYLYDNGSSDEFTEVISSWISRSKVTYFPIPGKNMQLTAYGHCIANHSKDNAWIAFLDSDEYLFSPGHQDIQDVIKNYEAEAGIVANWVCFGTSGHRVRPEGPVTINYTKRCALDYCDFDLNLIRNRGKAVEAINSHNHGFFSDKANFYGQCNHVKSIVNTRYVTGVSWSPHHFSYVNDMVPVTTSGVPTSGPFTDTVDVSVLRINHYFTRSEEEYLAKLRRGRADTDQPSTVVGQEKLLADYNLVDDTSIYEIATRIFSPDP